MGEWEPGQEKRITIVKPNRASAIFQGFTPEAFKSGIAGGLELGAKSPAQLNIEAEGKEIEDKLMKEARAGVNHFNEGGVSPISPKPEK